MVVAAEATGDEVTAETGAADATVEDVTPAEAGEAGVAAVEEVPAARSIFAGIDENAPGLAAVEIAALSVGFAAASEVAIAEGVARSTAGVDAAENEAEIEDVA